MKRLFATLLLALTLVSALPLAAQAGELTISAAASLTDAFNDVKAAFEAANPGTTLTMNYASSGALYRQIEQGAAVDVFASANPKWMNTAVEKGFVLDGTERTFALNSLVLITPADNPAKVTGPESLKDAKVGRIAIGTPKTVPAGQYAQGSLESLGLYATLESKYVFAENVRAVLDYVRRGEVDAGFVYNTDAIKGGKEVKIVAEMPLKKPVSYPIAVLKTSGDKKMAQAFLDFLASGKGAALLEARGFKKP
ncbi:MAG: molybdate ABC transporter substrate-binding protein [Desulfovibrionaceae bacterium]|jgi:molybdate transport system substrate-binding protein|nr:molybdate ABC transporter substrate-binding protein [Desulfovibrionaceae bacterium]